MPDAISRSILLQNVADKFTTDAEGGRDANPGAPRPPPAMPVQDVAETIALTFGDVRVSDGILDMRSGIAHSFFVEDVLTDPENGAKGGAKDGTNGSTKGAANGAAKDGVKGGTAEGSEEGEDEVDGDGAHRARLHHREC